MAKSGASGTRVHGHLRQMPRPKPTTVVNTAALTGEVESDETITDRFGRKAPHAAVVVSCRTYSNQAAGCPSRAKGLATSPASYARDNKRATWGASWAFHPQPDMGFSAKSLNDRSMYRYRSTANPRPSSVGTSSGADACATPSRSTRHGLLPIRAPGRRVPSSPPATMRRLRHL